MSDSKNLVRNSTGIMLKELIFGLRDFYGQEIYSGIRDAMSKEKGLLGVVFSLVRRFQGIPVFNLFFLLVVILATKVFRYPEVGKKVFQYGVTKNNVSAFNKLNNCLHPELAVSVSINYRGASLVDRISAIASWRFMWQAASILSKNCHSDPLVQVRSVIGAAAYVLYSVRPVPDSVEVLCVASDHSPVARALILIFHKMNKKTCYVQHAPVTEYFPPLSTSLSVLYDDMSVEAYRRAADRAGKEFKHDIVLMSPFSETFVEPYVKRASYNIGVCLGRFLEYERVLPIIKSLDKLESVDKLILRPHPACTLDLSCLLASEKVQVQPEGQSLADFASSIDVALVPSSGVTLELLHNGVPTFYVKGMDDLPFDYYGFVKAGILPQFGQEALVSSETINGLFDSEWKSRYSRYDVTVSRSIASCRDEVAVAFEKLLNS